MKIFCVRIDYHYEGSQDLLLSLDEATARGFFEGYCERVKALEKDSRYVSSQTDLELVSRDLDKELEWESETLMFKTWREIVGHAGKH